jgi:hypothetical protein
LISEACSVPQALHVFPIGLWHVPERGQVCLALPFCSDGCTHGCGCGVVGSCVHHSLRQQKTGHESLESRVRAYSFHESERACSLETRLIELNATRLRCLQSLAMFAWSAGGTCTHCPRPPSLPAVRLSRSSSRVMSFVRLQGYGICCVCCSLPTRGEDQPCGWVSKLELSELSRYLVS